MRDKRRALIRPPISHCRSLLKIMLKLVWLIPVLPLLGFLINFLLGRRLRLSERTVSTVACGVILLSLLLTVGAFYEYASSYAPAHNGAPYVSSTDPDTGEELGFPNKFTWLPGGSARTTLGESKGVLTNF